MKVIKIDSAAITDAESFCRVFTEALGLSESCTGGLGAWDACMASLAGSPEGAGLTVQLENIDAFSQRCPELYNALFECPAFVRWGRIEAGNEPMLVLSFPQRSNPR